MQTEQNHQSLEVRNSSIHDLNGSSSPTANPNGNGGAGNPNGKGNPNGNGALPGNGISITPSGMTSTSVDDLVQDVLINYNDRAKKNLFGAAFFRDDQIAQMLGVLRQKKKSNALLKGEAGVGKTQLVEEIARRLHMRDPLTVAALGAKSVIYELPLGRLLSGSSYVGQLEEKVYAVLDFACNPDNHVILFIDEIHMLTSPSSSGTYDKIAQILKPKLSSGEMRIIGATTIQEATTLLADPAFNRRWGEVLVPELSQEQAAEIVRTVKFNYEKHHNVLVPDSIIQDIVAIGDRFKAAGSHRPDSTLTLLDKAMSDAWLKRQDLKTNPATMNDPGMQAFLQANPQPFLDTEQVKKSAMTLLTGDETVYAAGGDNLADALAETIIGQEDACKQVTDAVRRLSLRLTQPKRPTSFLFAGASGTGKTEIAKQIARGVFGSEDRMVYINMSEFSNESSLNRLIGSNEGYIGSNSKRALPFDTLETNPYQLVLLDEFEKAAPNVQRLFMQALDEGRIQTNRNKTVDFSRALIIATTNAGAFDLAKKSMGFADTEPQKSNVDIIKALEGNFDREMLNRFEKIISFSAISKDEYRQILRVKYNRIVKEALENRPDLLLTPVELSEQDALTNKTLDEIVEKSYNPLLNGRPAERTMREHIEDVILGDIRRSSFQLL